MKVIKSSWEPALSLWDLEFIAVHLIEALSGHDRCSNLTQWNEFSKPCLRWSLWLLPGNHRKIVRWTFSHVLLWDCFARSLMMCLYCSFAKFVICMCIIAADILLMWPLFETNCCTQATCSCWLAHVSCFQSLVSWFISPSITSYR